MPSPSPLKPGQVYHIYNRGIDRCSLFVETHNYDYFLELYTKHVASVVDTFAYCLLPNHFRFLLRISEAADRQITIRAFSNH